MPRHAPSRAPKAFGHERDYIRLLQSRSRVLLLSAVFFLFAPMWLISVSRYAAHHDQSQPLDIGGVAGMVLWAIIGGLCAVCWVLAFTVSRKWLIAAIALNIFLPVGGMVSAWLHTEHGFWLYPGVQSPIPAIEGTLLVASLVAGYFCFNYFVNTEGKRRTQLETEIALAGEIHRVLVPPIDRSWNGWDIAGISRASGEMGGDLIDCFESPSGSLNALLMDVSGHGVKAGVVMALLKGSARATTLSSPDNSPAAAMSRASSVMLESTEPGLFATGVWIELTANGTARLCNAGHPAPLIIRSKDETERIEASGMPLGIIEHRDYESIESPLESHSWIICYSDGLSEARHASTGELLGTDTVDALIERLVRENPDRPARDACEAILREVDARSGANAQDDDMSVLAIRRAGDTA
ncbi:MAG: PP2C family protein-serine/threonine phosphatase [Phycisphaerales bacterium JB050]